jgi:hypothetical protein
MTREAQTAIFAGIRGQSAVAVPQSNTFMVVTPDGNVIIATSGPVISATHQQARLER